MRGWASRFPAFLDIGGDLVVFADPGPARLLQDLIADALSNDPEEPMKLSNDQPFPPLTASSVAGGTIRLPDELDREWAAVLFYRGHW